MTSVLVTETKLRPPLARRRLVERERLVDRFGEQPPLLLVVAPVGWGKTTLLSAWAAGLGAGESVAWLTVDRGDNDAVVFWTSVIASLRRSRPRVGSDAIALLHAPGTSLVGSTLPSLINDLATVKGPTFLVLDDYHLVTNPDIHEAMSYLVAHLPAAVHVVIATRAEPRLPVAHMRARGQLVEIDADDLRFTESEAFALLNSVLDLDLDDDAVAMLQQRTEGWAAGLCLAGLSLRPTEDRQRFIEQFSGTHRHLVDYLGAEVLDSLPEQVRSFLLRTSILESLCAPLCDAVAGVQNSADILPEAERANLFVTALDGDRTWYRYHHLFRELLRHELRRTDPGALPELHRRAASWYRDHGAVAAAVEHTTAAGDTDAVVELVTAHWTELLQQGRLDTVIGWFDNLAPELVASVPELALTRAWIAVNQGRLDELDQWLDVASRSIPAAKESPKAWEAAVAMLRLIHRYMLGDLGQAIEAAQWALEHSPEEMAPWRSPGCPVLGHCLFWSGDPQGGRQHLDAALPRARRAGNHLAVIHGQACMSVIAAEVGANEEAARVARSALEESEQRGLAEHWATTLAHVTLAKSMARQGRLEEAQAQLERAVELSGRGVARIETAYTLLSLAEVRHDLGDLDGAREAVRSARLQVDACPDPGILRRLVAGAAAAAASRRGGASESGYSASIEPLSDRELAVLRLLGGSLSQREIADALHVSINTVKSQTQAIYRKLRVENRNEAVRRAHDLGLVQGALSPG